MTAASLDPPPLWQLVLVTLSTDVAILAQWDGEQWWSASGIPVSNEHVINWRIIN